MLYQGSCACGKVTATIAGEPLAVRQCWCRACQKLAGGGATNNAIFLAEDIALSGEPAARDYTADSGNALTQSFCAACGTPVMAMTSARQHMRTIRLGFLEGSHGLAPTAAIWTREAPAWAAIDPALERFEAQPPPPAAPASG